MIININSYSTKAMVLARFCFVGVINTLVGYGTYVILILLNVNYALSSVIAQVVGVANSYFFNKSWTFKSKGWSYPEAVRFAAVYAVSYFINLGVLAVLVEFFKMAKIPAGFVSLIFGVVINFVGQNFWVFKQTKKQ